MPLPVRDFIKQRLLEYDPTFDTGDGMFFTSFVIDPLSTILQPLQDEIDQVKANQSIMTILESASPDLFPTDVVDGIGSNFILPRLQGSTATVTVQISFFEAQDFAASVGLLTALDSSGNRWTNQAAVNITAAEMSLNRIGTIVFVNVLFVSTDVGARFNITAGSITGLESAPAGVIGATNPLASDMLARSQETNTQYINRIKLAITVRALVCGRGIITSLTSNFTFLEEVQPIGMGDPEMMRDIHFHAHFGGNVDVYCKTPAPDPGQMDVAGLLIDGTRQVASITSIVAQVTGFGYPTGNASVDESLAPVVATSFDGTVVFTRGGGSGAAYVFDNAGGTFTRNDNGEPGTYALPSSSGHIYHNSVLAAAGSIVDATHVADSGATLEFARPNMVLTVTSPQSVAGVYQVKSVLAGTVEIFGSFPALVSNVAFTIDENVLLTYQFNPVSIDIAATPRPGRAPFTITDVPILYVQGVELLDPISGEPTGTMLEKQGGFGDGPYGAGGFGIGLPGDWQFVVTDPTLRFSSLESNMIQFSDAWAGSSVRVTYLDAVEIQQIQAYVTDPLNRTEAASILAKHYVPIFVSTDVPITYHVPAGKVVASEDDVTQAIVTFIETIASTKVLEKSDIVDQLYQQGADEVYLNFHLQGLIEHEDGTEESIVEDVNGVLTPPSPPIPPETSRPFSPRISHFSVLGLTLTRITS